MSKLNDEKLRSQVDEKLEDAVLSDVTGGAEAVPPEGAADDPFIDVIPEKDISAKKSNRDKDNTYFPVLPPFK